MAVFTTIGTAILGSTAVAAGASAFGAGLMTVGAVGAMGMGVAQMAGQKTPSMPQPPEAPKVADAAKIAEDRAEDRRKALSRTVHTSPLGLDDEAEVAKKTLLGQ